MHDRAFSKFTIILFSLFASILISTVDAAALPTVKDLTGKINHGQGVKVFGSGFGAKSPAAPLMWNDHEACATGTDILKCGYNDEGGGSDKAYIFNDKAYGLQGSKSARMDYLTTRTSMFPRVGLNIPNGSDEIYISYQAYWTHYAGPGGGAFIFKWSRGGSFPTYSGIPQFHETIRPGDNGLLRGVDRGYTTVAGNTYGNTIAQGQIADSWNRTEYHYKLSTPGVADGAYEQWVNSIKNVNLVNQITRTTSESSKKIDYIMTAFDGNDSYGLGNGYYLWTDDFYVDITPARVEICNGATWATRGNCEIQIPTAWSEQEITFTVNQGMIPDTTNRYLYVVDPTGAANTNGYVITFGSTGISAPHGLTIIK